jgi:hypothetical protein
MPTAEQRDVAIDDRGCSFETVFKRPLDLPTLLVLRDASESGHAFGAVSIFSLYAVKMGMIVHMLTTTVLSFFVISHCDAFSKLLSRS